jgi:hypothetical protein
MHLVYSGLGGRHDRMVVGFITTYAISAYMYHHWIWILFRKGVLDTTLCDKVRQWLAEGRWFSPCVPITSINKPDPQRCNWNIVESGDIDKHHYHNPNPHLMILIFQSETRIVEFMLKENLNPRIIFFNLGLSCMFLVDTYILHISH